MTVVPGVLLDHVHHHLALVTGVPSTSPARISRFSAFATNSSAKACSSAQSCQGLGHDLRVGHRAVEVGVGLHIPIQNNRGIVLGGGAAAEPELALDIRHVPDQAEQ